MRTRNPLFAALVFLLVSVTAPDAQPSAPGVLPPNEIDRMPPRLSFVDGEVSFFRSGDPDWTPALVNTALAPGDRLRTGAQGSLELQIGSRSYLRTWAESDIGLEDQGPDQLRFEVSEGHAALDLRDLEPGRTMEIYTPNAAFAVTTAGYYRVSVRGGRTSWVVRGGGRAFVIPAEGEPLDIGSEEEVVIEGAGRPAVTLALARPRDSWDDWNKARTEYLLAAETRSRHLPPGVYGAGDLERHGRWQVAPEYGPVWVPEAVAPDWAPYSAGQWMHDPYYGWTWVDAAPWGWAPFHHGRWVHLGGRWCWAPGPRVAHPVYAPALVAFFSGPQGGVVVGHSEPAVGWVALGWGEPCVPWWGRPGFAHRPWWGGWGGPRVVNNVVVHQGAVIHAHHIHTYRNAAGRHAFFSARGGDFERRGGRHGRRFERADAKDLRPMFSGPTRRVTPVGFQPPTPRGKQPDVKGPDRSAHTPLLLRDRMEQIRRDRPWKAETPVPEPEKRRITPIPRPRQSNGEGARQPSDPARVVPPSAGHRPSAPPRPDTSGLQPHGASDRNRDHLRGPSTAPPHHRTNLPAERGGNPQRPLRPRELDRRVPAAPAPVFVRPEGAAEVRRPTPGRSAERPAPGRPAMNATPHPEQASRAHRRIERPQLPAETRSTRPEPFTRR